jgi:hypothetical protein
MWWRRLARRSSGIRLASDGKCMPVVCPPVRSVLAVGRTHQPLAYDPVRLIKSVQGHHLGETAVIGGNGICQLLRRPSKMRRSTATPPGGSRIVCGIPPVGDGRRCHLFRRLTDDVQCLGPEMSHRPGDARRGVRLVRACWRQTASSIMSSRTAKTESEYVASDGMHATHQLSHCAS